MSGALHHTPSDIIAQLLDDLGLADLEDRGTGDPLTGWTVFPDHWPEEEQAILVQNVAGRLFGKIQVTGVMVEQYGIQLLLRSPEDPGTPYTKAKNTADYLQKNVKRELVTIDSRTYRVNAVTQVTPAVPAGNDGRIFVYSVNFTSSIELVEDTGTGS